jgi:AmiR/NasT family two-component response regulator
LFDSTSQDLGAVLAAQVGVAVAKSCLLADSQQVAVAAQRLADEEADVAVAQGMLMGLEDCTPEQAGALIRNAAACEAETAVGIARRIVAEVNSRDRRAGS